MAARMAASTARRFLPRLLLSALLIPATRACVAGGGLADLMGLVEITDYVSPGGPISDSSQLTCALGAGELCRWFNLPEPGDQFEWMRARLNQVISPEQFNLVTGKRDMPSGDFLLTGSPTPRAAGDTAVLVGSIPCQQGPGTLTFNAWSNSARPNLRICTQPVSGFGRSCQPVIGRNVPNPIVASIPGSTEPFEVRLEADGFSEPSFVMVDDLTYSGQVCDDTFPPILTTTVGPPGGVQRDCGFLECDFNLGTTCGFDVAGQGSRNGQWNVGSGRLGNPATGVTRPNPDDPIGGGYAYIGRDAPLPGNPIYVLESAEFENSEPLTVLFDLYQRSVGPVVQACIDSVNNCPYRNPRLDPQSFWYLDQLLNVPPGRHKIMFVGRELQDNLYMAVDNVRFQSDSFNDNICTEFF